MNDMKQKDDTMRATPEANKLFFDEYGREVQVRRELAIEKFRQLECQRDEVRELAHKLRDTLQRLADNGHTEDCFLLNRADGECDCGIDPAYSLITKAKEVLGEV